MQPTLSEIRTRSVDFWLARGAIALIAGLQLLVVNDLSFGPRWLGPALEITLLLPLSAATAWNQGRAQRAQTPEHWKLVVHHHRLIRRAAMVLTALITALNTAALVALVRTLLAGKAGSGPTLLIDALNIWGTNVIIFALWFWAIDRGGAVMRGHPEAAAPDFLFPQMTLQASATPTPFVPGFVDYLFLSFTNATAFSPTDTLPLSHQAKLLMMAEALISLLTVALVAARAVNILA